MIGKSEVVPRANAMSNYFFIKVALISLSLIGSHNLAYNSHDPNPDGHVGQAVLGGLDHVNPVIRLPLEHGISRVLGLDDYSNPKIGDDVDISTLTLEQYLALIRDDIRPGVVKPEIGTDVEFEINSNFMRELRHKLFTGTDDEDWNISSSSDTDGLTAVISKLDNLGHDMKKLKENVHAIQVGCQICKGPHLDKECPPGYYTRIDNQTYSGEKKPNLVETINKYMEEATKRQAEQDEWLKTFCQNTKNSRIDHDKIIQKLESQVKTLAAEVETKVAQLKECKMIFANDGTPLYTPFYYSPEGIEYFSSNLGFSNNEKSETTEVKTSKAIPEWKSNLPKQTVNHYVKLILCIQFNTYQRCPRTCAEGIRNRRSLPLFWRHSQCHYAQSISYYPQGAGLEVEKRLPVGVINT
ncbi:hypothetical protein Tco_0335650 [Tanacetum coccineum]